MNIYKDECIKVLKSEDMPEIDYGEDCCKRCMHYEVDKSEVCYMAEGKYYQGGCLITDTLTNDLNVCDFFEPEE
jgi:hypothetical protein